MELKNKYYFDKSVFLLKDIPEILLIRKSIIYLLIFNPCSLIAYLQESNWF